MRTQSTRYVIRTVLWVALLSIGAGAQTPLEELQIQYPGIRTHVDEDILARVYGVPFGIGSDPIELANDFLIDHSDLWGVLYADWVPGGSASGGPVEIELMYDNSLGTYKFTLVAFTQVSGGAGGKRVNDAEIRILVHNETNKIWLVSSTGRDLGGFTVDPALDGTDLNAIVSGFTDPGFPGMVPSGTPEMIVWAGNENTAAAPTVAIEFTGDDGGIPRSEAYRYVIGLTAPHTILKKESLVHQAVVNGTVRANVTEGFGADICHDDMIAELPKQKVRIASDPANTTVYTNLNGTYQISNAGSGGSLVAVESLMEGEWFTIDDAGFLGAPDDILVQTILNDQAPVVVDFLHNAALVESRRSQANAYLHANRIREFVLKHNPDYPGLDASMVIQVNAANYCGAFYIHAALIQLMRSGTTPGGTTCPNWGFSSALYHEYGHHLVAMAGSGQNQYGEGMGDVMSVLLTDESKILVGYHSDCSNGIRDANNDKHYPCTIQAHECGKILSGCIWDMRSNLRISNPNYIDDIANLVTGSFFLHMGTKITPAITIDFAVLDDWNGTIADRTPNYGSIHYGFGAHSMLPAGFPAPPPGPPPGSCPFLSVLSGGGWVDENTILTQSEFTVDGVPVEDFYPIEHSPLLVDGHFRLRIEEREDEVSYLDDVKLLVIDSDPAVDVRVTSSGEFFYSREAILPASAHDYRGHRGIEELVDEDSVVYVSNEPGWLEVTYDIPEHFSGRMFAGHSVAAKLPCSPPQEKRTAYDSLGQRVQWADYGEPIDLAISFRTGDAEWVELERTPPRDLNTPTFTATNITIVPGMTVEVRYAWSNRWVADVLPLLVALEDVPQPRMLDPLSAVHSVSGDMSGILRHADDEFAVLRKGESIELTFPAGMRPSPNRRLHYFVQAKGYYSSWVPGTSPLLPDQAALHPGYPNPFNAQSLIAYALDSETHVRLEVYNITGQRVAILVDEIKSAGEHTVRWQGANDQGSPVASGVYIVRMIAGEFEARRKMTMLK